MEQEKIDSNTPEPRKVSLLENIVFGIEAGAMDDPPTPNPTPEPPRLKRKRKKRTAPKERTDRQETERQYKRWAKRHDPDQLYKLYDPDQQCKRYLRKHGL